MWRRAVGCLLCVALAGSAGAATAGSRFPGAEVAHFFPGPYYAERGQGQLRGRVLDSWPGPTALVKLWEGGTLGAEDRVVLLLGAGFFHDPQLLRVYGRALRDPDQRVRKAAVAGYRELIGDRLPPLEAPVTDEQAEQLRHEVWGMATTLRTEPLVAVWLDALLHTQGQSLPGSSGFVLERTAPYCLDVVDSLAEPEDLPLLAAAYPLLRDLSVRGGLIRILEGLTLQRFYVKPEKVRTGWGHEVLDTAQDRVELFLMSHCRFDAAAILRERLALMGAHVDDPFAAAACPVWWQMVAKGDASWAGLAAEQVYYCGGPAVEISKIRAEEPENKSTRRWLLMWSGWRG